MKNFWNLLYYFSITFIMFITLFPIYGMIKQSLVPEIETYKRSFLPSFITLENYLNLSKEVAQAGGVGAIGFQIYLRNSFIISTPVMLLTLLISSLGGYSLSRLKYKGRDICNLFVVLTYLIPPVILMVPLYFLIASINMLNTFEGLILVLLSRAVPFCTWFMTGYFKEIPKELEEAAFIDGASRLNTLFRVVLPVSLPGLVVNMIFAFTLAWNDFVFSFILIDKTQILPLSVAMYRLIQGEFVPWGILMSGGVIASIVPVTLFLIVQRYIVTGLTAGAVKM